MKSTLEEPLEGLGPIARDSVEERVADTLRELIVSGQLPEGTPLVQRDVAQRLGVSQTPVRIGLSELQREGLVEVGDTGRALVSRLTREDFEEIYAARLGLEGLAARVGVEALTDPGIKRMRALMRKLDRLAKEQDVARYLDARWDFHAVCYRASGRTRLVAEVERLFWRAERYNHLVLSNAARFRRSVGYYREFLSACEAPRRRRRRARDPREHPGRGRPAPRLASLRAGSRRAVTAPAPTPPPRTRPQQWPVDRLSLFRFPNLAPDIVQSAAPDLQGFPFAVAASALAGGASAGEPGTGRGLRGRWPGRP